MAKKPKEHKTTLKTIGLLEGQILCIKCGKRMSGKSGTPCSRGCDWRAP